MTQTLIDHYLVRHDASLREAMALIDKNGDRVAFVINADGRLAGALTDGDIRRALLRGADLHSAALAAATINCAYFAVTADRDTILEFLMSHPQIGIVPLVDDAHRPVSLATVRGLHQIPVAEPDLGGNELKYVTSCLRDGWISSQGPFVRRFEQEFARRIGVPHAIATSSGTTALHLALLALGVGPGDEVIVPDLTFAASINAVLYCGATPVLVDVEPDSWNVAPTAAEAAVTERTKVIMVVHLYGQPAAIADIKAIADKHGLMIVEDAAEALGATYQGRQVGSFSDAAAFSFYGNKLITTGEGGMVVAPDPAVADRVRVLRDHGMSREKRYWHDVVGYNYRMTNLQAAIGVAQLERVDAFIARKMAIELRYRQTLAGVSGLTFSRAQPDAVNVCWLFSCIIDERSGGQSRDALTTALTRAGIDSRPLFYPLHSMPLYAHYAGNRRFPTADWLSENGLSLPSAVGVSDAQIDYVCRVITRMLVKESKVSVVADT